MTTPLSATVRPSASGPHPDEVTVTLRVTNATDSSVDVLNPDMGRPSSQMDWPWSVEAYRASLLMSFGYLAVSVAGESGEPVEQEPLQTWATPVLRPRIDLAPGESFEVDIPLGRFFRLAPGGRYRVTLEYGDDTVKVSAEGAVDVAG